MERGITLTIEGASAVLACDLVAGYYYALFTGQDRVTRQQVALYSKFPIENDRRWDVDVAKHLVAEVQLPSRQGVTVVVLHLRGGSSPRGRRARAKQALEIKRQVDKLEGAVVVMGDFETDVLPGAAGYATAAPGIIAGAHTSTDGDDCVDSARFAGGRSTLLSGAPGDRIIVCRAQLSKVAAVGKEQIVTGGVDPPRRRGNWSSVPADSPPYRDLSDHLLLRGPVKLPE